MALRELLPRAFDALLAPSGRPISVKFPEGSSAGLLSASLPSYPRAVHASSQTTAVALPIITPQASSLPISGDAVTRLPAKHSRPLCTFFSSCFLLLAFFYSSFRPCVLFILNLVIF